jgi:hypothetical protein
MKYDEDSNILGYDYPEAGGCKLSQHTSGSTQYHVPEDLNLHNHNYYNLKSCKFQAK